ncbi:hypothetical protein LCGC14_1223200 [marine sediment metagenome]|uniref:Uncharacterized protein n=1 Tax=marine sediment metagenome TaxID=412755 RepID=A0A0F9LXU6_9ZZZZ
MARTKSRRKRKATPSVDTSGSELSPHASKVMRYTAQLVKTCTGCGTPKALAEFGKDKRGKMKRRSRCKACDVAARQVRLGAVGGESDCALVDASCDGQCTALVPDTARPVEKVWLCETHRDMVDSLEGCPGWEQLRKLAEGRRGERT